MYYSRGIRLIVEKPILSPDSSCNLLFKALRLFSVLMFRSGNSYFDEAIREASLSFCILRVALYPAAQPPKLPRLLKMRKSKRFL